MTPQELRNSILQLAIQGKLVEQRPEEGTAEELYQEIKSEKQNLIRKGFIKRETSESNITEIDTPFDIPKTWKWCRITDCGFFISGYTPKPEDLASTGIVPYFKVSDMNSEGNEFWLSVTSAYLKNQNSTKYFLKNTIVYPKNGGAVFTNKKRILAQNSVVDLNTGGFYLYSPNDLMFIYTVFSLIDFRQCYKGTALPTVDMDKLKSKLIPLPPLAEQKRIVAKIEELLPYIDRYEQAWSKLEDFNKRFSGDMQKSILQTAIQGKLVEQRPEEGTAEELYQQIQAGKQRLVKVGAIKNEKPLLEIREDEKPFDIPESWKWVRLGKLLNKLTDGAHSTPKYTTNGIPFISVKDVSGGKIDFSDTKFISQEEHDNLYKRCNPEKEDILLTKVGTTGIPVIVDTDQEFSLFVSVALLKFNTDLIFNEFLLYAIKSPVVQTQANENTRGVGNKNWVMRDIANTILPLPPLKEQMRIVTKLEEILPLCEKLK